MLARSDFQAPDPAPQIIDLRQITGRELDPLLLEETVEWQKELDWDFSRAAEMVRHFVDSRSLIGSILMDHYEVAGYGYSVVEDQKGLIGDFYIRPAWRRVSESLRLFLSVLDALIGLARVRRVECQSMLLDMAIGPDLQRERRLCLYERSLMALALDAAGTDLPIGPRASRRRFHIEPWADHHHEAAAGVITLAYAGHIDGQINDQYRSLSGARRFLYNIVQFPGCGTFFRQGSLVAFDVQTGWAVGIVLVSFIGPETGHVTQLCVTPHARHSGLGYELLRQSAALLYANGARRISLTVTCANREALDLYVRCGFSEKRRFYACVWES